MTSPYHFESDSDYYDALLTPTQRKLRDILEDDPVEYLEEERLTEDFINEYFEQIMNWCIEQEYVQDYIERYVNKLDEFKGEP